MNQISNGIAWGAIELILQRGIAFCINVTMARMLLPSDFGAFAIALATHAIVGIIVEGGYSTALVQSKEITDDDYSAAFRYNVISGCVCATVISSAAHLAAVIFNIPELAVILPIISAALLQCR